ncbi:UV radiation resistance protein and autophagy-related subunit 14-domain-containing protein [Syncephalis plumigaleata]|nr:UV radiation resistance protein and autophagy-related subunit 14-domain-containing protein [Syncephalis plumigaleata]
MECAACESIQRLVIVVTAFKIEHREHMRKAKAERDRQYEQVQAVLNDRAWTARQRVTEQTAIQLRITKAKERLAQLQVEYEQLKHKTATLKHTNGEMRRRLDDTWRTTTTRWQQLVDSRTRQLQQFNEHRAKLDQKLAASHKVLLRELMHVFGLRRISSRISLKNANITVSEHGIPVITLRISGHLLPEMADWYTPNYSRKGTNAACQLAINMLNLMAYYLNVKLPFIMIDQGAASFAYRSMAGGDTRMSPLYLTDTNSDQFTRGFAMICYNAAYLCHLRGFESTLEQSTFLLWQLWHDRSGYIHHIGYAQHNLSSNMDDTSNTTKAFTLTFDQVLKRLYSLQRPIVMRESVYLVEREETGTILGSNMETWDLVEMPLPPTPAQRRQQDI